MSSSSLSSLSSSSSNNGNGVPIPSSLQSLVNDFNQKLDDDVVRYGKLRDELKAAIERRLLIYTFAILILILMITII
jgi:hypothetical protein